jgi:hypothetical protein
MNGAEAWTIAGIGFCLGLAGREVIAGWAEIFRALVAEIRLLVAPKPVPVAQVPEPVAPAISDEEFGIVHAWAQMNPWYATDKTLNMEAQIIHMRLRQTSPELSLEANLAAVTAEMHRRHPKIIPTRQ